MTSRFLVRKLLRLLLTLWAAVTLVFVVLRLSGDPIVALVPADLPDAIIDQYRERLGLTGSILEQYGAYLSGVLRGDFGYSFRTAGPAWDVVASRVSATLLLGGAAMALAILVGIPAGIAAAHWHNRAGDRVIMTGAVFGYAMPNFFFGILLILLFTLNLQWLPSGGMGGFSHLIMPTLTLGLASAGAFARFTRSSLLEVLGAGYMRTARAKGLSLRRQMLVHALRGALVPLTTLLGFTIGALIAGAVVTETVFAWPGVGRLLVVSVSERDLAVVQLIVILAAATMAFANLAVDLAYGWLDPRIGQERRSQRAGP